MKVGFAVIGVGIWGQVHIKAYLAHSDSRLVAICDKDGERVKKIAQKFSINSYTTEYEEILENPEIDAVSVATPDFAHREIAVMAAKAGKHILVEKPLATTVEDCEAMIKAAKKAKVKLMVDFHNRWNPPFVQAKEAVMKGEIGSPSLAYLRLNLTRDFPLQNLKWPDKSSVAFFMGSHAIDVVRWICDDEVEKVYAVSRSKVLSKSGVNTPDFYQALVEFKKGTVAVFENCWALPFNLPSGADFKLELIGSEGAIYIDATHHRCIEKYTGGEISYPNVFIFPAIQGKGGGFAIESIKHFVDCVTQDFEPIVNGEDGLAVTKIIEGIIKSADSGEPVRIS